MAVNTPHMYEGKNGVVYYNEKNPNYMIKVFKKHRPLEKNNGMIAKLTKNNHQKFNVIEDLDYDALPNSIKQRIERINGPLSAIRMNYLGTSIKDLPPTITCDTRLLLQQILKLLKLTKHLVENKIIHSDLHPENILISDNYKPLAIRSITTPILSVIDWNLRFSFDTSVENIDIRPSLPPEWFHTVNNNSTKKFDPYSEINEIKKTKEKLYNLQYTYFEKYWNSIGINHTEDLQEKIELIQNTEENHDKKLETFDNYGLGLSLLVLLLNLTLTPSNLIVLTRALLEDMCNMNVMKRPTPDIAVSRMEEILSLSGGSRKTRMRRKHIRRTRRASKN